MVDADRLASVGKELRDSIPADIQEATEILKQKDSIVNQAHLEARRVKEAAQQEQASRINQTEIVKAAETKAEEVSQQGLQDSQRKAYRIVDEAEADAAVRRDGADQYAKETLFDLEERLANLLGQVRKGIDILGLEVETNGSTPKAVVPQ
jgi:cell division septum initiation protein DivIVA